MNRIFVDMDGVLVDYLGYCETMGMTPDEVNVAPNSFYHMSPIPGAIDSVRELIALGFDVFIASMPPYEAPHAYMDKAKFITEWLPELKKKIILTQDKGLLGDYSDFIIDDRPNHCNIKNFRGILVQYVHGGFEWPEIMAYFRKEAEMINSGELV